MIYFIIDQLWPESNSINNRDILPFNLPCDNYEDIIQWTECHCFHSQNPTDLNAFRPLSYLRHGIIQNSSSQCHNKINREILLGYLQRRFSFQSKFYHNFIIDLIVE